MRIRHPRRFLIVVLLILASCLEKGDYEQPTEAIVHNQSSVTLRMVKLRTDGFVEPVADLEPGERVEAQVMAKGESGVAVSFETGDGRVVRTEEQGYFEGNGRYRLRVTVNADLSVSVNATLRTLTGEER